MSPGEEDRGGHVNSRTHTCSGLCAGDQVSRVYTALKLGEGRDSKGTGDPVSTLTFAPPKTLCAEGTRVWVGGHHALAGGPQGQGTGSPRVPPEIPFSSPFLWGVGGTDDTSGSLGWILRIK